MESVIQTQTNCAWQVVLSNQKLVQTLLQLNNSSSHWLKRPFVLHYKVVLNKEGLSLFSSSQDRETHGMEIEETHFSSPSLSPPFFSTEEPT